VELTSALEGATAVCDDFARKWQVKKWLNAPSDRVRFDEVKERLDQAVAELHLAIATASLPVDRAAAPAEYGWADAQKEDLATASAAMRAAEELAKGQEDIQGAVMELLAGQSESHADVKELLRIVKDMGKNEVKHSRKGKLATHTHTRARARVRPS
jgi:hypothetical protein